LGRPPHAAGGAAGGEGLVRGGLGGHILNASGALHFLSQLSAQRHHQPRELLLQALEACPQLQPAYLAAFPFGLDVLPPSSAAAGGGGGLLLPWLVAVEIYCSVLNLGWAPSEEEAQRAASGGPSGAEVLVAAVGLPLKLSVGVLSKGLQHPSAMVRYHVLLLLGAFMARMDRVLGQAPLLLPGGSGGSAATATAAAAAAAAELQGRLPGIQMILALAHREAKSAAAAATVPQPLPRQQQQQQPGEGSSPGTQQPSDERTLLLRCLVVRLLTLYVRRW
jgi:hypothetical protein